MSCPSCRKSNSEQFFDQLKELELKQLIKLLDRVRSKLKEQMTVYQNQRLGCQNDCNSYPKLKTSPWAEQSINKGNYDDLSRLIFKYELTELEEEHEVFSQDSLINKLIGLAEEQGNN